MHKKILFLFLFTGVIFITDIKSQPKVKTGLEVLMSDNYKVLQGKRVGLITNQTGVDSKLRSIIDILYEAPEVNLVAMYGPEHGVRGDYSAGEHVGFYADKKTGLPVYSLYGKTRKPTPEMLKDIDVLVYDIQDIGCRSYTFISTMGYAMEAAAENNIHFVVLDRPNPLGGKKIEGAIVEEGYFSIVSAFPIPYVYGLTCGELANLINKEKLLAGKKSCKLTVVPMKAWKRKMKFEDTGLEWVLSSPHIPHAYSAPYYVATGVMGELGVFTEGVGYTLPFQIYAAEWIDPFKLADVINALDLKGVIFRPVVFKPYYGKWAKKEMKGVQIHIIDADKFNLMGLQFMFMDVHHTMYPDIDIYALSKTRHNMFDKVTGSSKIREAFFKNYKYSDIEPIMNKDVENFRTLSKNYYLYK
ncbi:MAG: DUF1343 domain-containing protein [Bacteroidetes bacterium]|nr:DUF1343 domain-containing protein [Bacteroidota bacterium]